MIATARFANPPRKTTWIVSAAYDQLFMIGAWLVPFALWAIASISENGLLIAFTIFLFLDRAHVVATLPMSFLDRTTMREHGRWYAVGFAALIAAALISTWVGGLTEGIWISVFLYWGAFHIVRQHYGLMRLYQARGPRIDARTSKAEILCLYAGTISPYLLNLSNPGTDVQKFHLVVPPIPAPLIWIALAIFAYAALQVIFLTLERVRTGQDVGGVRLLYLLLALSNFWVACLGPGRTSMLLAALFITSFHDLQYHGIVWHVLGKRCSGSDDNRWARLFRMRTPIPFALLLLFGALMFIVVQGIAQGYLSLGHSLRVEHPAIMRGVANVLFAMVYAHYLFDGKMWRMKENPRLRKELGL